jgi:L,D-peptidoglycan transpeptidase YkuD (ErfK/YbiS/YcfS/YnhG family)
MNAVVGRSGFAPVGEKREGDGRTPSGLYRLGTTFGYAESAVTKMPYRQALADDLWIDDPKAPDYNNWVKQGQTRATSYEKMRRNDNLYQYGIVIAYNTYPVIKNHGSAIFIHVWADAESTTAGCVAVSEEDILKILAWLNPEANPVILINPEPL